MPEFSDQLVSRHVDDAAVNGAVFRQIALEHQFSQQFSDAAKVTSNAVDLVGEFGHSAIYSGFQSPAKGLAQLFDNRLAEQIDFLPPPEEAPFFSASWHAQQLGSVVGITVPFMLTRSAMKSSGLSVADKVRGSWLQQGYMAAVPKRLLIADAAATGFVCDFFTHPVSESEGNPLIARTKHGVAGAVTMGSLTAASIGVSKLGGSYAEKITGLKKTAHDVTSGALSGIPAGLASADVNAGLFHGRFATNEERAKSAYTMMFAGGTLSGLHKLEGQDSSIVQHNVGRYGDRQVKMVGGRGSDLRDAIPFNWDSPRDNFRMGTEFSKVELDVRGRKEPYYVLSKTGGNLYNHIEHKVETGPGEFYLLARGRSGPVLIRDFEVMLDSSNTHNTSMTPAPKAGSRASAIVKEGAKKTDNPASTEAKIVAAITVGRVAEGTIKISRENAERQQAKVISIPESASASFELGAHFNHVLLDMRGKPVEYYRARMQSREHGIEPNEFYILADKGPNGQKLIRDTEVFLQPNNGKEGMPTKPLSDDLSGLVYRPGAPGRFWTAKGESLKENSPPESPALETPALKTPESTSSKPKETTVDTFEPYVETFEPPREYDPTRNFQDDAMSAMLNDLQNSRPTSILPQFDTAPASPYGTKVVGTTGDGTNIRFKPGWEKNFRAETRPITDAEIKQLGATSSEYSAVEVVLGENKVRLFQNKADHQFYRLKQSPESGPTMQRDFSIFEEPPVELHGLPELRAGWYLNRWTTPVDPVAPPNKPGIEIGEANGTKILRNTELGHGLRTEVIAGIAKNPSQIAETPFEKIVVQIDGSPVEYFRLKLEPNRFYRWDPNSSKLTRDHTLYLKPKLGNS